MASWIAAATSYSTNNRIMVPFYVYYSMFGFQRIGDLAWAAGDMQARGFLLGGTSGRTTLNGEGLQHEDGHSHILAGTIPNCVSYDPTFAHEVGVILHHGLKRMVEQQDNVYYYITLLNENYPMPGLKPGTEEQIIKGMYLLQGGPEAHAARQPAGQRHHPAREHRRAGAARARLGRGGQRLELPELQRAGARRPGLRALEPAAPGDEPRVPFVTQQLGGHAGPVVASTDYMKNYAEQIRAFIPKGRVYKVLGTDGFGRSDFRSKLREHFEVNRHYIVMAALKALADEGTVPHATKVAEAIAKYGINVDKVNPLLYADDTAGRACGAKPAARTPPDKTSMETRTWHGGSEGPGHRRLQEVAVIELLVKPGDTSRPSRADHGGERQGVDGDPVVARRRGQGAEGRARRQGQRRQRGAAARAPRRDGAPPLRPGPAPASAASTNSSAPAAPATGAGTASAPAAAAGGEVEVKVPDIGDFAEVAVIEVMVKPGDTSRSSRA
jgi:hypothetical protein